MEPTTVTLEGATLTRVHTAGNGVEYATFAVVGPDGQRRQLSVPTACVRGAWPPTADVVTLEYSRNDGAAGARCGYQSVVVR